MKNKQKEKILLEEFIYKCYNSGFCYKNGDWCIPKQIKWIKKALDSIREETLGEVDVLKMAEEFEEKMTSGFGLANIHGMGNVHLFAGMVQGFINNLKTKK